jgi:hypothetical protein
MFRLTSQSLQTNVRAAPQKDHDHFLPNSVLQRNTNVAQVENSMASVCACSKSEKVSKAMTTN